MSLGAQDEKVPYDECQGESCGHCPYCSTWRCDCSGYVSYIWGFKHGYVTQTLPQVSHEISVHEMLPGDVFLDVTTHVMLFAGWTSSKKDAFHAYQETGCQTSTPTANYQTIPYPSGLNWGHFVPYRKNGL